jgi:hypothetical protein
MSENRDRVERTLELLLYAPLGAGLYVRDVAPSVVETLVARGRAEIDRRQDDVQQRVTTARSLGQVALAFGVPMVRQKVRDKVEDARRRAEDLLDTNRPSPPKRPAAAPPVQRAPAPPPATAPVASEWVAAGSSNGADVDAPDRDELPIPGYDALSASQVVERLIGLAPTELDAVHAYENAHRQRRTILGKIEQLAG